MRRTTYQSALLSLAAISLYAMTAGCAVETHTQAKKNAYNRWAEARAGILYSQAMRQFEVGDLEQAQRTCAQGIAAKPDQADFYELLGRVQLERGELERAYQHLTRSVALDEERHLSHYLLGVVLQRWQKYEEALTSYKAAYAAKPDEVAPLLAISEMLVKLGQIDQAISRLQDKLVYFEHNAAMRMALGRLHTMQGKRELAVKMYREAALLAPDDSLILEQLAMAELSVGHHTDAAIHIEQLLEVEGYENRTDLKLALGDCYVAAGDLRAAGELFIQITRNDRTNVTAWVKLGEVAWGIKDYRRAGAAGERLITLAPDRHEGYLLQGMVLREAGNIEAALEKFIQAQHRASNTTLPHIMAGLMHEQVGDLQAAAQAYRMALKVDPNDPRGRKLLAGLADQL